MRNVSTTTEADGIEYPVTFQEFETFEEVVEAQDGEDGVLASMNARQKQGATQSPKGDVRKAIRKAKAEGYEAEKIQEAVDRWSDTGEMPEAEELVNVCEAISSAQKTALEYVTGASRRGGISATAAGKAAKVALQREGEDAFRERFADVLTPEEIDELLGK